MGVKIPDEHMEISEGLVAFVDDFKGKRYVNIRKTYEDRDTGELSMGKGLCIDQDTWDDLEAMFEEVASYINQHK